MMTQFLCLWRSLFPSPQKPPRLLSGLGFCVAVLTGCQPIATSPPAAITPAAAAPPRVIEYQTQSLPGSVVHLVKIPVGGQFEIVPAIADELATVEQFAAQSRAAVVINAGYFDPVNQQTTSFITLEQRLVADPRQNRRLMENPNLTPYLDRILNRSEFRSYQCGQTVQYAIALHQSPVPSGCTLRNAIGAGPQLLPELTLETEGFVDRTTGRDAIGSNGRNARSAVGITAAGDVILAIAAQKPEAPTQSGLSLPELATVLQTAGAVQAINLDGGSSTSLVVEGQAFYGKVNANGEPVQRAVKSVLMVRERTP